MRVNAVGFAVLSAGILASLTLVAVSHALAATDTIYDRK